MQTPSGAQGQAAAEGRARALIDEHLTAGGWSVQDRRHQNLFAAQGVAVREVTMKPGHGRADYLLHADKWAVLAAAFSARLTGASSDTDVIEKTGEAQA